MFVVSPFIYECLLLRDISRLTYFLSAFKTVERSKYENLNYITDTVFNLPNSVELLMEVSPEGNIEATSGSEQPPAGENNNNSNNNNNNGGKFLLIISVF